MSKVVEIVNPGAWEELKNDDRKILKFNTKEDISGLNDFYKNKMEKYLSSVENVSLLEQGQVITGKIVEITDKDIKVDINYKDYAYIDNKSTELKIIENLKVGDKIDILITEVKNKPFQIKASISELVKIGVEKKLRNIYESGNFILAKVVERISAGFMMEIDKEDIMIKAFMPNTLAGPNKLTEDQSENLIGTEMNVCLETLQQDKGVYVVSRKKYLQKFVFPEEVKNLKKDKVYTGYVTGTAPFGIFVQFNDCLTGMIYKANINPEYQDKISYILPGTEIDFYVKDVLKNGKEIILTQILKDSLWDSIEVGQIYESDVINVKNNGILVALDYETKGIIPASALNKTKKYKKGDKINVEINNIVRDERLIFLKPA